MQYRWALWWSINSPVHCVCDCVCVCVCVVSQVCLHVRRRRAGQTGRRRSSSSPGEFLCTDHQHTWGRCRPEISHFFFSLSLSSVSFHLSSSSVSSQFRRQIRCFLTCLSVTLNSLIKQQTEQKEWSLYYCGHTTARLLYKTPLIQKQTEPGSDLQTCTSKFINHCQSMCCGIH